MKTRHLISVVAAVALVLACVCIPAVAASSLEPSTLKITNVTYPTIMGPNSEGTLVVTLINTGTQSVVLNDIYFKYYGDDDRMVTTCTDWRNLPYRINPGASLTVPVPIQSGSKTGPCYATICVDSNYGYVYDSKQPVFIKIQENTPELAITNFKVTQTKGYYTLDADIHNLGYDTASALKITTVEGGDVGPYSTYILGDLDKDDLAGFTLTFNMPESQILTIITDYKDANREHITNTFTVNIANHLIVEEKDSTAPVVFTVILVIIIVLIVVAVVRKSRKGKKN